MSTITGMFETARLDDGTLTLRTNRNTRALPLAATCALLGQTLN